jgi:chemotaxis protein CheZ
VQLIHELNQTRDRGLYQEVGKLTRELHSAIVNFQIDPHMPQAEEVSQITDATERLSYVVKLTEARPTAPWIWWRTHAGGQRPGQRSPGPEHDWGRFMRREVGAEEFRELARRVDGLSRSEQDNRTVSSNLNDILLAQDYQDLTGQVIKRVTLVTEVESNLLKLVLMASQVDRLPASNMTAKRCFRKRSTKTSRQGEGPQIHADKREDVVSGQDDVDDLLSSLGF